MEVPVEYVKWGLANRFDDHIELNEALKKYPKLHHGILEHELGHKNDNKFRQDLVHDLTPLNHFSQKDLIVFMIKNPKTLTQLFPVYYSPKRKQIIYDLNMLIIYGFMIGILILLYAWL